MNTGSFLHQVDQDLHVSLVSYGMYHSVVDVGSFALKELDCIQMAIPSSFHDRGVPILDVIRSKDEGAYTRLYLVFSVQVSSHLQKELHELYIPCVSSYMDGIL